jgi:hypothetical protein
MASNLLAAGGLPTAAQSRRRAPAWLSLAQRAHGRILEEENAQRIARSMPPTAFVLPRRVRCKEGFMAHAIYEDDPEQMIAILNRNRHIRVFAVVAVLVLGLGTLLMAAAAMYSDDPVARTLGTPPK